MLTVEEQRGVVLSKLGQVGSIVTISRKSHTQVDDVKIISNNTLEHNGLLYVNLTNKKAKGLTLIDKYHPKSLIYDNAEFIYVSEDGKYILQFTGELDGEGNLQYNSPKTQPKYGGEKRTQVRIFGTYKTLPQIIAASQGEQLIDLGLAVGRYIDRLDIYGIDSKEDVYNQIKSVIHVHHINSDEDDDRPDNLTYLPAWLHYMIHSSINPNDPTNITAYELHKVLKVIKEDRLTVRVIEELKSNRVRLQWYLESKGYKVTTRQSERIRGYLVDLYDPTTFPSISDLEDEEVAKKLTYYQYLATVKKQLRRGKTESEAYDRILRYEEQSFASIIDASYVLTDDITKLSELV